MDRDRLSAAVVLGNTNTKYAELRLAIAQAGYTRVYAYFWGEGDEGQEEWSVGMTQHGEDFFEKNGLLENWEDWVDEYNDNRNYFDPLPDALHEALEAAVSHDYYEWNNEGSKGFISIDLTDHKPVHISFDYPETNWNNLVNIREE